jgi:hypothetical protein
LDTVIPNFVTPPQLVEKFMMDRKIRAELERKTSCMTTHFPTRNANKNNVKLEEI